MDHGIQTRLQTDFFGLKSKYWLKIKIEILAKNEILIIFFLPTIEIQTRKFFFQNLIFGQNCNFYF